MSNSSAAMMVFLCRSVCVCDSIQGIVRYLPVVLLVRPNAPSSPKTAAGVNAANSGIRRVRRGPRTLPFFRGLVPFFSQTCFSSFRR